MWHLDGSVAHLETSQFACQVDLLRPVSGLLAPSVRSADDSWPLRDVEVLQVDTGVTENASTLSDVYVRGTDLVATYGETTHRQVRPQVYWRYVGQHETAFGVEVILSLQTSKLNVQATLETASNLPSRAEQPHQGLYRFELPVGDCCYVEMVHPSNLVRSCLTETGQHWRLQREFFTGRLEKGVIHRAMLRGMFLTRKEPSLIEQLYREFLDAAPPLTT